MPKRTDRSRLWPSLAGVAISLGLLVLIIRQVDLGEVRGHLATARVAPLAVAVILATATFPIRAARWRLLLPSVDGRRLPFAPVWHAVAIGFMANNVLPFRMGELLRPVVVARLAPLRLSTALSSVAVERIFDALTVTLLLAIALLAPGLPADVAVGGVPVSRMAAIAGLGAAAALAIAGAMVLRPLAAERAVRALLPAGRLADRLVGLLEGIRQGLSVLHAPGRAAGVALWSLALWLTNALSFYVAFAAFDIDVSFVGALLVQGLTVFGVSVPSTPGYVGPLEAAIVAALALYGVPAALGFSYAIAYHVTTFVPITLLGLWSLFGTPVALRDLRRMPHR